MALTLGARLGVYEIIASIGVGGMGEVYRATDTTLGRQVAIKILPEAFASDPERLARFEREAKTLASLNHPHIAAIYGFEKSAGIHALVMELVDGPTLADRIAQGPISLDEALPIAKQIAEALEAAHEQGIIHRDLKPANIKVRSDGTVKVLDFGLAKAMEPTGSMSPNVSQSPTITTPAMTRMGVIMGTAAYMSPEQARGKVVDKRADIWAFGCVLYEMLTGKRAFEGEDVSDTIAAVLRGEPDWDALPATTPAPIGKLLRGCLEKDRKERVPDIAVARLDIKEALAIPAGSILAAAGRVAAPPPLWKRAIPVAATALFLVAALTSVAWWSVKPSAPPPIVTRFSFPLPQGQALSIANSHIVGMSPDGTRIVYAATTGLYLRSAWDLEPKAIPGTDSQQILRTPVFSPDGQSLVFYDQQVLKRISVTGGAAVTLCPADVPFGISWGLDGIVFGQGTKGIMRVSPNGGQPERLVSVKDGEVASGPQVLPGGQAMLFTLATGTGVDRSDKAQVVVQSLKSGERKTLVNGGTDARYVPTGHIVYAVGGTLFALAFDAKRLEVAGGAPVPIVEGVQRASGIGSAGAAQFSFSDTGALVYISGPAAALGGGRALGLADRKGSSEILKLPPGAYGHPRISPDGKRVAFDTDDGKEAIVWIYDLAGTSSMRRLTFGQKNRFPIWSGDGQRIAFQSDREGDLGIFWQRADGTGTAERLTNPEQGTSHVPESWSPDGKRFLFAATKDSSISLWAFVLEDKKATPFGDVQSTNPINAVFSPDGRWVAYYSNETGSDAIYVQPFPVTGAKYQIPKNDPGQLDHHPVWSSDGKELFYIPRPGALAAISVTTRPDVSFGNPVPVPRKFTASGGSGATEIRNYDLTPDGKILGLVDASEQTQSGYSDAPEFRVVLNWFEELKARVPTK